MSCSDRRNKMMRDLKRVEILAQAAANLLNAPQKIYKTICDGVQVYKFSHDWQGKSVKIVRPDRQDTSESVLRSDEHVELEPTESSRYKNFTKKVRGDVEQST